MGDETKSCPECAEKIQLQAIKCRHCGAILDEQAVAQVGATKSKETCAGARDPGRARGGRLVADLTRRV